MASTDAKARRAGEPYGVGVRWIVHVFPFHVSASSDWVVPAPLLACPTAVHAVDEAQETP